MISCCSYRRPNGDPKSNILMTVEHRQFNKDLYVMPVRIDTNFVKTEVNVVFNASMQSLSWKHLFNSAKNPYLVMLMNEINNMKSVHIGNFTRRWRLMVSSNNKNLSALMIRYGWLRLSVFFSQTRFVHMTILVYRVKNAFSTHFNMSVSIVYSHVLIGIQRKKMENCHVCVERQTNAHGLLLVERVFDITTTFT